MQGSLPGLAHLATGPLPCIFFAANKCYSKGYSRLFMEAFSVLQQSPAIPLHPCPHEPFEPAALV